MRPDECPPVSCDPRVHIITRPVPVSTPIGTSITIANLSDHIGTVHPVSLSTDRFWSFVRSTKPTQSSPSLPSSSQELLEEENDCFPPSPTDGKRTHFCYAACMPSTCATFTDQTGRFITPSSQGNNQLMILYDYDSNSIHAEPMPSKTGTQQLAT